MLFRLERNPKCKQSDYIQGRGDDDPTPPKWIEVLAIQPDKLVPQSEGVLEVVCTYLCMSEQGFFTVTGETVMHAIAADEYRVVSANADAEKKPKAKRAPKKKQT